MRIFFYSYFQKLISINQINTFQCNNRIFFCFYLEVFTKKFSEGHREMPIFLGRLKKYVKNRSLFGICWLKTFSDKTLQRFSNSFETSAAEFNTSIWKRLFLWKTNFLTILNLHHSFLTVFNCPKILLQVVGGNGGNLQPSSKSLILPSENRHFWVSIVSQCVASYKSL